MRPALLALCLAACTSSDPEPTPGPPLQWTRVDAIGAAGEIHGVESDGAGGLWIAYPDRLTHLDGRHRVVAELPGAFAGSGLTLLNGQLWLAIDRELRAIDPATGATTRSFAIDPEVTDLAASGSNELLLSRWDDRVVAIDALTGGEIHRTEVLAPVLATRGIAYAGGHFQVASWLSDDIYIADRVTGEVTAIEPTDIARQHEVAEPIYVAWDDGTLVLATRSQIWWFAPSARQ